MDQYVTTDNSSMSRPVRFRTIWKFPLPVQDEITVTMPLGSRVLCVQTQPKPGGIALTEQPCIWALVDPEQPTESRHFRLYGTGHSFDLESGSYVGTFQLRDLGLVFHLFEATS